MELMMRVHLGVGVAAKPTLRDLQQRVRGALDGLAAGKGPLSFLEDFGGLLDLPIDVEEGLYVVDIEIPKTNQQPTLLPVRPRQPRGARLGEQPSDLDQQLVDEIATRLQVVADVEQQLIELTSTSSAAALPEETRRLQDSIEVDLAALRKSISTRDEPLIVRLPDQREFGFPPPPPLRRTVVAEAPTAIYVQPRKRRESVDLSGPIVHKVFAHDGCNRTDTAVGRSDDLFELHRSYSFRFAGVTPGQHAVIVAAWALGCDVGLVARYATSTSTVRPAPAEVDEVLSWARLVQRVAEGVLAAASTPYSVPPVGSSGPEAADSEAA
jgi:hypothetical protein